MKTWWLAIDKRYTSYEELKYRKVIAQGWPKLGDLSTLIPLVQKDREDMYRKVIDALNEAQYGQADSGVARIMLNLLNLKKDDLIVGIEGTKVRGICQLERNAIDSYRFDSPDAFHYTQTVGFPVKWHDWNEDQIGFTPIAPAQSVDGLEGLNKESQQVIEAWRKLSST